VHRIEEGAMTEATSILELAITEQHFPRYDPSHGTPDPMIRRVASLRTQSGSARFEQTDYGHPGRFNEWESRGIDAKLQPRIDALRRLCEDAGALLA
jgi:hypothetical protein